MPDIAWRYAIVFFLIYYLINIITMHISSKHKYVKNTNLNTNNICSLRDVDKTFIDLQESITVTSAFITYASRKVVVMDLKMKNYEYMKQLKAEARTARSSVLYTTNNLGIKDINREEYIKKFRERKLCDNNFIFI